MNTLPGWVNSFNNRRVPDSLLNKSWNTLYPIETYTMSDPDDKAYEGKFSNEDKPVFPHKVNEFAGKNFGEVANTPHGNTLTLEFAKQAIFSEGIGNDDITDFLALSLSSPDYIGHKFCPNSIEV
jgi:hypothetical protein